MTKVLLTVWLAVAAMLVACSGGQIESSGISGHTVVDVGCPTLPVDQTACPQTPLSARLTVTDSSGRKVAETVSNERGEFRINLRPGAYTIIPSNLSGAPLPYASPTDVTVLEHAFTDVELRFDSGVR